jgi:transcriptional regulator with XRE-family HTH domain
MESKIGERLAIERKRLGFTQAVLAASIGKSPQNVSNWEVGRYQPPAASLERLSKLGFDLVFVLSGRRNGVDTDSSVAYS